jgi:hypothetical protein
LHRRSYLVERSDACAKRFRNAFFQKMKHEVPVCQLQ